ncbi:MAG TPA: molybdenum cofactor guanylyltransferase [Chitinophagaceae bacterium]
MLGVVLCGGQSSRMGSDKGLLKLEAKTWAQTAFDKVAGLNFPIVISVNEKQHKDYAAVFPANELITDDGTLSIHGPLSGVLSVHLRHPAEDLLVLACDMPLMETALLKELLGHYRQYSSNDAFVYTNDGESEPLCGIYKAKGLAHILSLYQNKQLPKHSMKYMLEHIATHTIPVSEDKKKCFRNFNAHAELNGL